MGDHKYNTCRIPLQILDILLCESANEIRISHTALRESMLILYKQQTSLFASIVLKLIVIFILKLIVIFLPGPYILHWYPYSKGPSLDNGSGSL